jgi:hAT family C-terminal dimerisation region
VLRNIPIPVVDVFSNSTTNLNPILPPPPLRGSPVVQAATNVRRHITMIQYRQAILNRSPKRRRNDFDRYIKIPNDPNIPSQLGWWRDHYHQYPDMGRMVRDVLAVPASGCAVECQFSVSGKMTVWQHNRLSPKVISDAPVSPKKMCRDTFWQF